MIHRCATGICCGVLGLAATIAVVACGGSSERTPTGPTVTTPPAVTPPPPAPTPARRTFTLDAPSDHFQFSTPLAGLQAGEGLEVAVRPLAINRADGERFGHSVGVWVFSGRDARSADLNTDGIALVLGWSESGWVITSRTPEDGFRTTSRRVQIPFGELRTFRVMRSDETGVQFGLDGETMFTLSQALKTGFVFAQVVGAQAEFSYFAPAGTATADAPGPRWTISRTCGFCPKFENF